MTITFKTVKGATVELTANYGIEARVIGRDDMRFSGVELVEVAGHGLCVAMGPIKAEIRSEDLDAVKAFFAAEEMARKERAAAYLASDEHKDDAFRAKFYRRNSDY
ncbi:MAG: hypothetical protein J0I98_06435 [Mesorhizobium sp.]|nr:hypothetical protein [Mesorhizobium sp.]MBN9242413.1 hypothetical protein [Mesorhizobium sp.]